MERRKNIDKLIIFYYIYFQRWDLHHRWTMSLLDEFFLQGDKERELGLPFSPLCDRNNTLVAESQIGFIEFIVEPSMQVCADMLECILGPLHSNSKSSTAKSGGQESISEESAGEYLGINRQSAYRSRFISRSGHIEKLTNFSLMTIHDLSL